MIGDAGRQPEIVAVPSAAMAADRPDTVFDGGRLGALDYRAVSVRGFSHQEKGLPRQDAYQIRPSHDGAWLVGCVADGVSEGRASHLAADLVCREVTAQLRRALAEHPPTPGREWPEEVGELPWQQLVAAANTAIVTEAAGIARAAYARKPEYAGQLARLAEREYTMADARQWMSSTGVAFAVRNEIADDGAYPAMVAVLAGDSSAMLLREGSWQPLTPVKNEGAEVLSSTVNSLPCAVTVEPIATRLLPGDVLVVMTDGLGDALASGAGVVGRFLATMWRQPPDQHAYAEQLAFYRKAFTDDRTAVAIWVPSS